MIEYLDELENVQIDTKKYNNLKDFLNSNKISSKRGLSIIHFNIRSLRKHFDELLVYIETAEDSLDIVVLSETGKIDNTEHFNIPNFNIYYNDSAINKCDGVIIYIKNSISTDVNVIQINDSKFLRTTFTVYNQMYNENITVGLTAFYRSPSRKVSQYLNDLEDYLNEIKKLNLELYIGDINIDLLKTDNSETNNYLNVLNNIGFFSCINSATRVSTESKTAIDHIFMRTEHKVIKSVKIESAIILTDMTDHFTPVIHISFPEKSKNEFHCRKVVNKLNLTRLRNLLAKEKWEPIIKTNDSQIAYQLFIEKLNNYINTSTTETITNFNKKKKLKPWITAGLITSIQHRDKMKVRLLKNYSLELENEYKNYRNRINHLIRKTKNEFYQTKIAEAGNDYKKIWSLINNISGKTEKKKVDNTDILITGTKECTNNNLEKANIFNSYFKNVGIDMAKNIPKIEYPKNINNTEIVERSIFLKPVTNNEVIMLISKLKNNSAPGSDKIAAVTLKNIHEFIILPLKHIINLCFSSAKIPKEWKETIITPIHKSGDDSKPSNYRPISMINNLAKIFENALKDRLLDFFRLNKVINTNQYGFMKNSSTEKALLGLVKQINKAMDLSLKSVAIFLDLAKAFDTVSHRILLQKLHQYGVRGKSLELLENYLSDRYQKVKIGQDLSTTTKVEIGVPQGTVLGPILFVVYINSIFKIKNLSGHIICYADDTAIFFSGKDWNEVRHLAETDMQKIHEWLTYNMLTLNITKTKYLTFSPTIVDQPHDFGIKLHHSDCDTQNCACPVLQKVSSFKYLGILVDQHIRWSSHITYINNRLRSLIHKFYILRSILSRKNMLILYNSLAESLLRYCIVAWGAAFNTTTQILQRTQNVILKIILFKNWRYNTEQLYKDTNVMNLKLLFSYQSLITVFLELHEYEFRNCYNTRATSNRELITNYCKKTITQRSFFYFSSKLYNVIPLYLKEITSKKRFKSELKKYILANPLIFHGLFT